MEIVRKFAWKIWIFYPDPRAPRFQTRLTPVIRRSVWYYTVCKFCWVSFVPFSKRPVTPVTPQDKQHGPCLQVWNRFNCLQWQADWQTDKQTHINRGMGIHRQTHRLSLSSSICLHAYLYSAWRACLSDSVCLSEVWSPLSAARGYLTPIGILSRRVVDNTRLVWDFCSGLLKSQVPCRNRSSPARATNWS